MSSMTVCNSLHNTPDPKCIQAIVPDGGTVP